MKDQGIKTCVKDGKHIWDFDIARSTRMREDLSCSDESHSLISRSKLETKKSEVYTVIDIHHIGK